MADAKQPAVTAIVFCVSDIKRTQAFYRDALNIETRLIEHDADGGDDHHGPMLMGEAGDVSLIFFQRPEKAGRTPVVVFGLDRAIDETAEALAKQGVEIVTPVSEAPGGWTFDFADPDGHVLSFYQSGER